jgi:hypothetical protein
MLIWQELPTELTATPTHVHPGVELADVEAATGWDLAVSSDLRVTQSPSPEELCALRQLTDRINLSTHAARRSTKSIERDLLPPLLTAASQIERELVATGIVAGDELPL